MYVSEGVGGGGRKNERETEYREESLGAIFIQLKLYKQFQRNVSVKEIYIRALYPIDRSYSLDTINPLTANYRSITTASGREKERENDKRWAEGEREQETSCVRWEGSGTEEERRQTDRERERERETEKRTRAWFRAP